MSLCSSTTESSHSEQLYSKDLGRGEGYLDQKREDGGVTHTHTHSSNNKKVLPEIPLVEAVFVSESLLIYTSLTLF